MANLIDKTYFIGDISLPGNVLDGDYENISSFITRYEKEILMDLLGYDLYKTLKAQIDADSYAAPFDDLVNGAEYTVGDYTIKWEGLINSEKKSFIAYYIYYRYMQNQVSATTSIGEVMQIGENSSRITPADKMTYAWNKFVELYGGPRDNTWTPSAYRYIQEHKDDFDKWVFTVHGNINSFGI